MHAGIMHGLLNENNIGMQALEIHDRPDSV